VKVKVYDVGQANHMYHWVGGKAMSTPTKATRWYANVTCEGCREERMGKDRKCLEYLKIEATRQGQGGQ